MSCVQWDPGWWRWDLDAHALAAARVGGIGCGLPNGDPSDAWCAGWVSRLPRGRDEISSVR